METADRNTDLSCVSAILSCLVLSVVYVASLYVWSSPYNRYATPTDTPTNSSIVPLNLHFRATVHAPFRPCFTLNHREPRTKCNCIHAAPRTRTPLFLEFSHSRSRLCFRQQFRQLAPLPADSFHPIPFNITAQFQS